MEAQKQNFIQQLIQQHQVCDTIFKNFPMGVLILNREKRIIYVNQQLEQILNSPGQTLQNQFLTQFLYPDDIPYYIEKINAILDRKQPNLALDARFLSVQGDLPWYHLYLSLITITEPPQEYCLVIARDIHTQKQNEDLLKEAKIAAEAANRAKTEFLANISHEIRTPIHTIVGMTELLLDTNINKEQKKYIKQVRFSAEALLTLINHVLDFSRIESGKVNIEDVEFNLYRMLENIIDLVIQDINKKKLEMILFIDSGVPELIKGDPIHLHQIIRNLLNNALKFTEEGEILLSVSRLKSAGSDIVLRFSIQDSGIGIENTKIGDIFNPFSQADNSSAREYGGTGVGLSIVKKLLELMGGRIEVESKQGEGSIFYFDIAFKDYQEVVSDSQAIRMTFTGTKVLVIDDNRTTSYMLNQYLSEWGCQVTSLGTDRLVQALQAKQLAELFKDFDIALMDLKAAEIRTVLELSGDKKLGTKLILLRPTGLLRLKHELKYMDLFDADITKPLRKRDLFAAIFKQVKPGAIPEQETDATFEFPEIFPDTGTSKGTVILVVEDHEVNREFFCTILGKMGYEVKRAENGVEAIRLCEQYTFDLIFMDIQMPGMNGYEVTACLREKGIKVPIIAVTANTVKGEILRCLQAGMNDYLAKPFKKNDLIPLLNKWLESNQPDNGHSGGHTTEQTQSVFDFEKAVEMFMGQQQVVMKLLEPFVERLATQIENMREAVCKQDWLTIQHEAHTIKGGALNIQANEMGQCALALEKLAREQQQDQIPHKLDELEQCYLRFRDAVAEVLKKQA